VAHPQIAVFASSANGSDAPTRRIEGQRTLLGRTMHDIEYDELHDEIVVPQQFAQAILTFRGSASGEEPPIRVIQGSRTGLRELDRLGIDPVNGEIFVPEGDRVLVFPREASGNVAPSRILETELGARGVAVDPVRDLLVVTSREGENAILMYDRRASGRAKPRAMIRGPKTMLTKLGNVRVHSPGGWILVTHDGVEQVGGEQPSGLSFVGVWSVDDRGDVAPRWTIGGPRGMLRKPRGVALDPVSRTVVISDKELNAVLTYRVPEIFAKAPATARLGASVR
jgi:hypothetical protein